MSDLTDAAALIDADLVRVRYAGETGVAEMQVPMGASASQVEAEAMALFQRIDAPVAPLAGGEIIASRKVTADDLTALGSLPVVESATRPEALEQASDIRALNNVAAAAPLAGNDWASWFPSDWDVEAYNFLRCTQIVGGKCVATTRLAAMDQSFAWKSGNTPSAWPDADWGLEIGLSLYSDVACTSPAFSPGWWANAETYAWATSVPAVAEPYLDDDREFDACGRLSQEFGIGHPEKMPTSGGTYQFSISTPNRGYAVSSSFGASMQVVSNDCNNTGSSASSWCMGLNTDRVFPYGQQSVVLVNASRGARVPSCARMHDGWTAPVLWANNTSILLPAPLGYYDSCLSNDY
jgi:hypothetical protein